jgi:putative hydrolase of the HAD superfamily
LESRSWGPDTGAEYLRRVNESFGSSVTREDWVSMRKEAMVLRPEVLSAIESPTQHGQVTLLRDNGILIGEHLAEITPHLALVFGNCLFATAYYGARKPDALVNQRVLDRRGALALDTFFVADTPENLLGANEVGITTQWFSPHDKGKPVISAITAFLEAQP